MPPDVRLRDVTRADLPTFFEQQRDPDATRMAAFPAMREQAFLKHWTKHLTGETVTARTILVGGRVAGNVVAFGPVGDRHVGYWLGREYWGQGIATAALSMFLAHVVERPLYARVAKHNLGSIRVLEKNGFTNLGADHGILDDDGQVIDELLFKLT